MCDKSYTTSEINISDIDVPPAGSESNSDTLNIKYKCTFCECDLDVPEFSKLEHYERKPFCSSCKYELENKFTYLDDFIEATKNSNSDNYVEYMNTYIKFRTSVKAYKSPFNIAKRTEALRIIRLIDMHEDEIRDNILSDPYVNISKLSTTGKHLFIQHFRNLGFKIDARNDIVIISP